MSAPLEVEVVYALPERCWRWPLQLPAGSHVADALAAVAPMAAAEGIAFDPSLLAVFGRPVGPTARLHAGDRVELLRPLLADPKQARRRRASRPAR